MREHDHKLCSLVLRIAPGFPGKSRRGIRQLFPQQKEAAAVGGVVSRLAPGPRVVDALNAAPPLVARLEP